VYQAYCEEENARHVSEILEVEKPGVEVGRNGGIEYRYRRLLERRPAGWVFPCRPSARLLASLERKQLPWPAESRNAPEQWR